MSRLHPLVIHLPHDRLLVTLTLEERDLLRAAVRGNGERVRSLYLREGNGSLLNQHYGMEIERGEEAERLLAEGAGEMSADQVRWLMRICEEGSLEKEVARRIFNGEAL